LKSDAQSLSETAKSGIGDADIAVDRHPHPDDTRPIRRRHAHQEGDGSACRQRWSVFGHLRIDDEQQESEEQDEEAHQTELLAQVSESAFTDGGGDPLHRFRPRWLGQDAANQIDAVKDRQQRRPQDDNQDGDVVALKRWQFNGFRRCPNG
jgi:hypothetical protein